MAVSSSVRTLAEGNFEEDKDTGTGHMGNARQRLRLATAGVGFAVASALIFGHAGAAHAPTASATSAVPVLAAAAPALPATPENGSSQSKYSAEPFRELKVKAPATPLRMRPALKDGSYATLALGPIRYPDGAVTLPGRLETVKQQQPEAKKQPVGHSVSVPSGIRMAEAFNIYPSEKDDSAPFARMTLVSAAHAAPGGGDAMGGPLSRMPIEGHVLFNGDDDALGSEAQNQLDKVVKALRASHAALDVVAYGGKRGSKSSDARRLSLRRALAVRSYLVARGIDQARVSVRPMGGVRDDGPQHRVDVFYASY